MKEWETSAQAGPYMLIEPLGPGFTASPYWPPLARKMNLPGSAS